MSDVGVDIYLGQKFSSYQELKDHLKKYEASQKQKFYKKKEVGVLLMQKRVLKDH